MKSKYPFKDMAIGDVVTIEGESNSTTQKRVSAATFDFSYRYHNGAREFSTKQTPEGIQVKRLQ